MHRFWPPLALLVASVIYRAPVLVNARALNSDAAIVGLQAWHMLRGEWSLFLWGTDYQSSIDALMIACGFLITGVRPFTVALMPLVAHLVFTWLTWDVLRKRVDSRTAAVATLPLVIAPMAVNIALIYVARQWCIATVFASIWLLDGASRSRRSLVRYAAGAATIFAAIYMDLFALQMSAGLAFLAIACCFDARPPWPTVVRRIAAVAFGGWLGVAITGWLGHASAAPSGHVALTVDRLKPNFMLLVETCLPWTLSRKVFANFAGIVTSEWRAPPWFQLVQQAGAGILVVAFLLAGALAFHRRLPWTVRRLGLFGVILAVSSIGGFLLSTMPADAWSCRYLSPIIYAAPFALAPLVHMLRRRLSLVVLAPYLLSAAVGGWISYGVFVNGPFPAQSRPGSAREEGELATTLRQEGIRYAAAQYWLAYRLSLLFRENPIVVPLHAGQDRYPPYRVAFAMAPRVAYIFHPEEPRATAEDKEAELNGASVRYERREISGFTVLFTEPPR